MSKTKFGRDLEIYIDGQKLVDIMELSIPQSEKNRSWNEKGDAMVLTKNLKKTRTNSGTRVILTCRVCKMPEDIILQAFEIIHEEDFILWKISPPGAGFYYDEFDFLELKFHKPLYVKAINDILQW